MKETWNLDKMRKVGGIGTQLEGPLSQDRAERLEASDKANPPEKEMKNLVRALSGLLLLATISSALVAQEKNPQESLLEKHASKLKKEFLSRVTWEGSFDSAMTKAKKEGKLILAYFTRSYAP